MSNSNNKSLFEGMLKMLYRIEKKIDRIDTQSSLEKDYLSTKEACTYLSCSRTMLWKLVEAGKVNRIKLGNGRTYYASAELKDIIENPVKELKSA